MGCNCGDNEYNITVDNNGNCEPTTPVYNITLANVGVNGYSPIVRFVNETIDSFNIAVDNVTGTETSPAVPKLSYVSDQLNNINTTIANLGNTYLTVNGSNAANPITFNHLTMGYQYGSPYINSDGNLYIRGAVLSLQATGDINLSTTGTSKAYYNNNEIATVNNLDTYLKTDGSNINRDFSITNHSFTINNTTIDDMGRIIGNTGGALYLRDAGGNTSLSVDSQGVSILNNIGQSFTINNKQIATVDQIPTVGNGTITITQDGVTKGTFTTNQSGNATIELDSGVTNPLTITDEGSNNFLEFIVNSSGSYIRTGTQGLAFNGYLITTVDNPLSLDNVAFGLKAIALKYDNDTIKVNQDGQLYADVQGGGGSYTAGTGIDITSNVISVDNTVAMKTDIPTNNNQLTNGAGYITASALNNYVTNSTLTTTLADYQPLLVSGTNIKTINNTSLLGNGNIAVQPTLVSGTNIKTVNNTSLLGSGNIDVLQNTASRNTSLTIGDNASTLSYTTNVGIGSQATATAGQAFGHYAIAGGQYSLALGQGAEASSNYAIQLGKGTNATATTLSVGFGNNGNYQLLNGTTGLIPDARISNNIARTSNVADKDLSNLSTTGQNIADTVKDQNTSSRLKYWTGTQAQYDAITTKDSNTIYNVEDSSSPIISILDSLYPIGAIYIGTMAACPLATLGIGTWQLVAQDRVLQGAGTRGSVGTTIEESLPNIRGSITNCGNQMKGTTNPSSSGALSINKGNVAYGGYSSDNGYHITAINLNASNSSSIYQDNAPVQQDGYLVNIWERIS